VNLARTGFLRVDALPVFKTRRFGNDWQIDLARSFTRVRQTIGKHERISEPEGN